MLKEYCKLALTVRYFEKEDIVCASNGEFASHDDNDVLGNDPGFWEVMYK